MRYGIKWCQSGESVKTQLEHRAYNYTTLCTMPSTVSPNGCNAMKKHSLICKFLFAECGDCSFTSSMSWSKHWLNCTRDPTLDDIGVDTGGAGK